ncbi:LysR family transcriptional regulator [Stenotrophomonas maltophilia]|nr:LysR family transcriptional regulator [Stenotrophomonas maltophilia]
MVANIDDLTVFVAVARARGFREAGRVLGVSPTTLSETVRRLEERLACPRISPMTLDTRSTELTISDIVWPAWSTSADP